MGPQIAAVRTGLNGIADKQSLLRAAIEAEADRPAVMQAARTIAASAGARGPSEMADALAAHVAALPFSRERVETFQGAAATLQHGGDCDDHVVLLGALCESLGIPTRIIILADDKDEGRHVFVEIGLPVDSPHVWRNLDTTAASSVAWSSDLGALPMRPADPRPLSARLGKTDILIIKHTALEYIARAKAGDPRVNRLMLMWAYSVLGLPYGADPSTAVGQPAGGLSGLGSLDSEEWTAEDQAAADAIVITEADLSDPYMATELTTEEIAGAGVDPETFKPYEEGDGTTGIGMKLPQGSPKISDPSGTQAAKDQHNGYQGLVAIGEQGATAFIGAFGKAFGGGLGVAASGGTKNQPDFGPLIKGYGGKTGDYLPKIGGTLGQGAAGILDEALKSPLAWAAVAAVILLIVTKK